MSPDHYEYSFKITIPTSTSINIVEWFKYMNDRNVLSQELIALVHNKLISIKSYKEFEQPDRNTYNHEDTNNSSLIKNIYNWRESNNELFKDEKKEKRKMQSV